MYKNYWGEDCWSIHGACFDLGNSGKCIVDENGECSRDCPGYEYTSEYYELQKNRKNKKKYYFISKRS